ncbi:hypothetical protein GCM10009422_23290 [Brevundimonas kwangchunensis]|uniref:Uncharacterized protein n=1 Tax=Brevundimonas kwangchunensis TaxID=322163 RepID=A0ABP3S4T7_9CAUL
MSWSGFRLLTSKTSLGRTLPDINTASASLSDREVLVALDRFSLTSSTLAGAAYGDALGVWDLFPDETDAFGLMPVWGSATVLQSCVDEIRIGARLSGWFPMAGTLKVRVGQCDETGFLESSPWRQAAPDFYNRYTFDRSTAVSGSAQDDRDIVLQPLYAATRNAFEVLRRHSFFAARDILLSTLAADRMVHWLAVVTQSEYEASMQSMGYCDAACAFGEVEDRSADAPTLYLDLTGDEALSRRVHAHLGDRLVHHCVVPSPPGDTYRPLPAGKDRAPGVAEPPPEADDGFENPCLLPCYANVLGSPQVFAECAGADRMPCPPTLELNGLTSAARVIENLARTPGALSDVTLIHLPA